MIRVLPEELKKTATNLYARVATHFPTSGLSRTCYNLLGIANEIDKTILWIKRPNYFIRVFSWILIGLLVVSVVRTCTYLNISTTGINIAETFQMIDAAFNSVVLLAAAGIFLMTFEIRRKRKRVINAVNHLRCIAHLVNSHQLTKDPRTVAEKVDSKVLSDYELARYLDFCSEMLSLSSILAFLYVQDFDDPVANEAVNNLEGLSTGLSQKIWQKIAMIKNTETKE